MTRGKERTGILPVGFYDGMSRLLSGRAEVIVKGKRAPVIGNICLDQTIIDLEGIPEAEEGDEVILFGRQGEEEITIKEIADSLDTIVTQVLSFITSRVPRIYI
jgi:alanine racemase